MVPAQTGGKGGAGSGVAPPGSGIGWGGAGEGVKAGSGLAASSSNRINGMRDNLGDRQERTESMGGCEATPVSNSTSAGQVHTATCTLAVPAACIPLKSHAVGRLMSQVLCCPLLLLAW